MYRATGGTEANPLGVHEDMFIPTIEKQGTDEQKAKYLERAKQYKIIGTYAQTELGHGKML
jgi:acyl-CoA oxidase